MAPSENNDKTDPLYPDASKPPVMVHVVAPATLPAGYTFDAEANGDPTRTFTVEVPQGGVNEGDTFLAPLPENFDGPRLQVPTGHWKDGLFDCFSIGFFHPHLWCAICCPQILMAQVMSRLQLTWLGEPGPIVATRNTFKVVLALVTCYIIYSTALEIAAMPYETIDSIPLGLRIARSIGFYLFTIWALYSLCKTRQNIRARYSIQEETCVGAEDCICSFCCSCCTVAQMARHTGEYETYPATCFTKTGHPEGTPIAV